MFSRFLLLILFSIASVQSFAATGKIYDSLSGAPISGATVYAVWYFQFFDLGQRCGGTALAVTDDRGEYTLDAWTSVNLAMHDYALWVVAPGYYDPWEVGRSTSDRRVQVLPRLDKPPPKSTSRAMAQIGNVSNGQVHDPRPRPTEDLSRVNALAVLENERRRQTRIAGFPSLATIYLYHWNWPASALLARTYSLVTLIADTETDSGALLKLQRSEVAESFNHLCSADPNTPVQETYEDLRLLWWAETQISDRTVADTHAQARALAWDNGSRCKYQDGKMVAIGGTSPPFVLMKAQACELWKPIGLALTSISISAPPMSDFHIDYSARPQACVEQRNFGSSI